MLLVPYAAAMRALQILGVLSFIVAGLALVAVLTGGTYELLFAAIFFALVGGFLLWQLSVREREQHAAEQDRSNA